MWRLVRFLMHFTIVKKIQTVLAANVTMCAVDLISIPIQKPRHRQHFQDLVAGLGSTGAVGCADGDLNADSIIGVLGDAFRLVVNLGQSNE